MNHYPTDSFSAVSDLLVQGSRRHGANGFSVGETVFTLDIAMDEGGPVTWALVIHANAIAKQVGMGDQNSINTLPFAVIDNPATPCGSQAIMQPAKMPMAVAYAYLDAALEHAVCLGVHSIGYTLEEWDELPHDQKVVPFEPYMENLRSMWITEALDRGSMIDRVHARPVLVSRDSMHMLTQHKPEQSQVLSFPSVR
ncbi:hypothetical protein [Pseudomonas sp.]|uniref:hypothetical protein n=1 Tax=Pseudomonas sp. TaxID=306 RepID=UPI00290E83AB|nr:hypothetical protein [Pseudomonas sp.]MDU4254422.1 hypothetical protein [Pseudomonas sp.]